MLACARVSRVRARVQEGQDAGVFRQVQPLLAYLSVMGPVLVNAARERAAAQPGREEFPMFAQIPHPELTKHMQHVALPMLQEDARMRAALIRDRRCTDRVRRGATATKCAPPAMSKRPKCESHLTSVVASWNCPSIRVIGSKRAASSSVSMRAN